MEKLRNLMALLSFFIFANASAQDLRTATNYDLKKAYRLDFKLPPASTTVCYLYSYDGRPASILNKYFIAHPTHKVVAVCHIYPVGSSSYNIRLSQARAEAFVRYVTWHSKDLESKIYPVGLGSEYNLVCSDTLKSGTKNIFEFIFYDNAADSLVIASRSDFKKANKLYNLIFLDRSDLYNQTASKSRNFKEYPRLKMLSLIKLINLGT